MIDTELQLKAAKKAKKIIQSCKTEKQLGSAKNFTNLFFTKFAFPQNDKSLGTVYQADASTAKLYNNLILEIQKKENEFIRGVEWLDY